MTFSTNVFANADPPQEETQPQVEENIGAITPSGNLTLVDDVSSKDTDFMTVVSKNGNYFYMVIDRDGDNENVHFLNMVDEADLMSLMTGESVSIPEQEEIIEEVEPLEPTIDEDVEEEIMEEVIENKQISTATSFLLVFLLVGAIGFGINFIKNKMNNDKVDDMPYDEDDYNDENQDDEYIGEDEEIEYDVDD